MKISEKFMSNGTETLEVSVYYSKGGMNYFTSRNERRGIYMSVTPVKINKTESLGGKSIITKSFTAFSGVKKLLKEVQRISVPAKTEALKIAEKEELSLIVHVIEKNGFANTEFNTLDL